MDENQSRSDVERNQHLLSLVSHVLLHFITEFSNETISPHTFDPRKPEHREFAVNQFGKVVDEIGVSITNFEAGTKLTGFVVPGTDRVQ